MTDQPAPKSPAFHHITDLLTTNLAFPSQTADQIALLLVEDEDALLAALGHDNCVPAQHCERCGTPDKDVDNALIRAERAEAERDRAERDAADTGKALRRRIEELRAQRDRASSAADAQSDRARRAEAERDRYRKALHISSDLTNEVWRARAERAEAERDRYREAIRGARQEG